MPLSLTELEPSTLLTDEMAVEWRDYGTRILLTITPDVEEIYAHMACPNPRPPISEPVIYLDNRPRDRESNGNLIEKPI